MLLEAALSFLGVGIQPPTPSWGNMIADGRDQLATAPWTTLAPGLAIALVVLALNAVGDGLRDALDPRTATTSPRPVAGGRRTAPHPPLATRPSSG